MSKLLDFIHELPIGFGGAAISGEGRGYGFGAITENESIDLLLFAKEHGIRLFDSAPIYGFSESEKRMGKAFVNCREEVFLVSKSGVSWHKDTKRVNMTNDPKETVVMLENSLRNFNSDYIDLYMIHWPDPRVDIRRPLEVLAKAKDQGKIKHIGLCNTTIEELEKAGEVASIEAVQSQLNIFETQNVDDLFIHLEQKKISFMSWGTLDKGILTGTVNRDREYDSFDCRKKAPWWKKKDYLPKVDKMQVILKRLSDKGKNGINLALGFNFSYEALDCALVGVRTHDQVLGVIESYRNKIPKDELSYFIEGIYE